MAVGKSGAVSKHLRTLFQVGTVGGLSDRELLTRFSGRRDEAAEAAFAALVERHGSMVLSVCRGVLDNPHDAEDAFQATFLVLALRAAAIRDRDSLASWLFGVARRAATKAKVAAGRRRVRERRSAQMAMPRETTDRSGGWADLHEEVDRLPEKYRAPIVLCYLGGLTHQEAADQLRLPLGTVKVRLSRARERLRGRLARRGLAPALIAAASSGKVVGAAPVPLVDATIKAAVRTAAGRVVGVSASVAALVEGVLKAMFLAKLKAAAASLPAGVTLFLASVFVISVASRPAKSDPPPVAVPSRDGARKVSVERLKASDFGRTTLQTGTVEAFESVDLTPKFSGYLKSLKVDIGDVVKRGQVVAEIDAAELAADLEKSQAQVVQAKTRVSRAQAAVKVVEASLEAVKTGVDMDLRALDRYDSMLRFQEKKSARYKDLVQNKSISSEIAEEQEQHLEIARSALAEAKAKAITAKAGVVEAEAKREAAKADVEESMADLRIAELDLRKARMFQDSTTIISPLDGVVTRRGYHVGAFVRADAERGAAPLLTVINTGKMRVVVEVPDRDVPLLDKGDHATVRLDAIPDREYHGTVSRTAFAEDPAKRTLRTEIDLDNADGRLRPGQFGAVSILLQKRRNVLTVPASALVARSAGGEADCYRAVDGHAVRTRIKTGDNSGIRVEVLVGLREGDNVLADPGSGIKDGQAIEVTGTDDAQNK